MIADGRHVSATLMRIGSISETITRQLAWRSDAAEPLPISPKPATTGFQETGRMPGVGEKFGKPLDLVLVKLT